MTGVLRQINRSNGGLPKLAVEGPVQLTSTGIEGDWQRNRKYHGGPNQAVLMIAEEVVQALAARGYAVSAGSLGENLTVSGLDPHAWRAGQRYQVGAEAIIELTKLRQPCLNLDVYGAGIKAEIYDSRCKKGDVTSPCWAHGGFYAKVVRGGLVTVRDCVALLA